VLAVVLAVSEPSKVPWYISGGVLALYAVVLAAIGLRRPDFPGSIRGQRAVIAVSVVLVAVAIGSAILSG
jgi:hypothetical protein